MSIRANVLEISKDIPENVKLVAVSKTKSNDEILEAYHSGHIIFGENKVQELIRKQQDLPKDIEWHYIGHLQRNKVKFLVSFVHLIHAVDSMRLLRTLQNEAKKANRKVACLLQMHIAQETTKFGLNMNELKEILESDDICEFDHVEIKGLMGMATYTTDKEKIRKEFQFLKHCFDTVKVNYFKNTDSFSEISMGMSGDYAIAIEEGSTIVRIGSLIFGDRNYS